MSHATLHSAPAGSPCIDLETSAVVPPLLNRLCVHAPPTPLTHSCCPGLHACRDPSLPPLNLNLGFKNVGGHAEVLSNPVIQAHPGIAGEGIDSGDELHKKVRWGRGGGACRGQAV